MKTVTETNTITGEKRTRLTYAQLGQKMVEACGIEACIKGYQTSEVEWIGRYALMYGDIRPDGTLN